MHLMSVQPPHWLAAQVPAHLSYTLALGDWSIYHWYRRDCASDAGGSDRRGKTSWPGCILQTYEQCSDAQHGRQIVEDLGTPRHSSRIHLCCWMFVKGGKRLERLPLQRKTMSGVGGAKSFGGALLHFCF